ncbi:MAG: TolC family protein [Candidatus Erginobacter occultus]|nr:TolC family protein [Candidatus Erginobacter occultus]
MRILFIAIAALLLAPPARAEGEMEASRILTLNDCLEAASHRNPIVLKALQEIEAAGGLRLQALSDALPHLSGEADYLYLDRIEYFESEGEILPLGQHDNYSLGLTVEQNLYQGGKVLAGIKAASLYNRYADVYFREALGEVSFRVKEFFYLLLLQEGIVSVRGDTVKHMEDYLKITEDRHREGTASEFDLITARVRLANSRPPLIEAENRVDILKTSLLREIGSEAEDFAVRGELEYRPFAAELEELNRLALDSRPLLRQMALEEEIQEQNLRAARSGYQPHLSIFATYQGDRPQGGLPPEDKFEFEWLAGARVRWSLFDGLMTPGRVREERARLNQARITTEDTTRTVLLSVKQARLDIEAARRAYLSQQETVEHARAAYRIARVRWENGISTSLELTDAELNLSEARVMLDQSLAAYRISLAGLEQAVGLPLDEIEGKIVSSEQ